MVANDQDSPITTLSPRRWDVRPTDILGVVFGLIPAGLMLFMVVHTNSNIPRSDTSLFGLPQVAQIIEGEFGIADLFQRPFRHPLATTFLTNALLYWGTNWNLSVGRVVAWGVSLAGYLVVGGLALHTLGRRALWVWPLLGVLYFPLSNMSVFALFIGISQFYLVGFSLAAYAVVLWLPRRWWTLALAYTFALLAGVSFASGIVAWGLVLLALLYRGYRDWRAYGFLIFGGLVSVGVLAYVLSGYARVEGETASISLANLRILVPYLAVYLGRMFYGGTEYVVARDIGYAGLALFTGMAVYLAWAARATRAVVAWGLMAIFAVLNGVLISLGAAREIGFATALYTRYLTTSGLFWVAFVGLFACLLATTPNRLRWLHTALMLSVGLFLSVLAVRFVPATYQLYHNGENDVQHVNERCHLKFLYHRDAHQMWLDDCVMLAVDVDGISYYEVSMFTDHEPTNMFADGLEAELPVIQTAHDPGINFNAQKWLLANVPAEQVLHLAPMDGGRYTATLPNFVTGDDPALAERVRDFVGDAPLFWYVYQESQREGLDYHQVDVTGQFAGDYTYVERTYETREGVPFQQRLYVRQTADTDPVAVFAPDVQVRRVVLADTVAACGALDVVSAWSLGEPLDVPVPLSLGLALLDENGAVVARSDSQLSVVPTTDWEPDRLYVDLRTLDVPCEFPPGNYTLVASIYDYRAANDPFPLVASDGVRANLGVVRVTQVVQNSG